MLVPKINSDSSITKKTELTGRKKFAIFEKIKGSVNVIEEKIGGGSPFFLPSLVRQETIVKDVRRTMGDKGGVCCVCDELVLWERRVLPLKIPNLPPKFFTHLLVPEHLPLMLRAEYDITHLFLEDVQVQRMFDNLLLSPRGVLGKDNDVVLQVCETCHGSLANSTILGPPKFSIANGFAIGRLPAILRDATLTELALVSFVLWQQESFKIIYLQVSPLTRVGYIVQIHAGGGQRQLRGHIYSVELDVGVVARSLPLHPADSPVRVILSGPFTPVERLRVTQLVQVRPQMLRKLFRVFSGSNNRQQTLRFI